MCSIEPLQGLTFPLPLPGQVSRRDRVHGFRFARLLAGYAPPVATFRGPAGAEEDRVRVCGLRLVLQR
jgi:hypothetical protein